MKRITNVTIWYYIAEVISLIMIATVIAQYIMAKLPDDNTTNFHHYKRSRNTIPFDIQYIGDNVVTVGFTRGNIGGLTVDCFEADGGLKPISVVKKDAFLELTFEKEVSQLKQTCDKVEKFQHSIPYALWFKGWERQEMEFVNLANQRRKNLNLPELYYSAKLSQIARSKGWEQVSRGQVHNDSAAYGNAPRILSTFKYHLDGASHQDGAALQWIVNADGALLPSKFLFDLMVVESCYSDPLDSIKAKAMGMGFIYVDTIMYMQFYFSDELRKDSSFEYGIFEEFYEPSSRPPKALPPGAITGIVIGIILALSCAGLAVWFFMRKGRLSAAKASSQITQSDTVVQIMEPKPSLQVSQPSAVVAKPIAISAVKPRIKPSGLPPLHSQQHHTNIKRPTAQQTILPKSPGQ